VKKKGEGKPVLRKSWRKTGKTSKKMRKKGGRKKEQGREEGPGQERKEAACQPYGRDWFLRTGQAAKGEEGLKAGGPKKKKNGRTDLLVGQKKKEGGLRYESLARNTRRHKEEKGRGEGKKGPFLEKNEG